MSELIVGGFDTLSTIDYPDMLAAVVYLQGCAWRCGYCHNKALQPRTTPNALVWNNVLEIIKKKSNQLDGVVFSGGEPLLQYRELIKAMQQVRKLGFVIGMHTSGYDVIKLESVIPYCDWVGLDIKAPPHKYQVITNVKYSCEAWQCVDILMQWGVDYQIRITHDKTILTDDDIISMRKDLIKLGVDDTLITIQNCNKGIVK